MPPLRFGSDRSAVGGSLDPDAGRSEGQGGGRTGVLDPLRRDGLCGAVPRVARRHRTARARPVRCDPDRSGGRAGRGVDPPGRSWRLQGRRAAAGSPRPARRTWTGPARRGEPTGSLRDLPARPRGGGLALGPDRRRASTRRRRHGAPVPRPPPSRRRRDPGAIPHGVRPGCRARAGRGGRRGGSRAGRRRMRIGRMRIGRRLRRRRMQQQGRAGSRCCRLGLRLRLIATWRLRLLRPQRPGGRAGARRPAVRPDRGAAVSQKGGPSP